MMAFPPHVELAIEKRVIEKADSISGQPKVSFCCLSANTLGWQKEAVFEEIASFYSPIVLYIAVQYLIFRQSGYRMRLFLQKEPLSQQQLLSVISFSISTDINC